ncbi:unnamed protein product [Merluccius merluccius]
MLAAGRGVRLRGAGHGGTPRCRSLSFGSILTSVLLVLILLPLSGLSLASRAPRGPRAAGQASPAVKLDSGSQTGLRRCQRKPPGSTSHASPRPSKSHNDVSALDPHQTRSEDSCGP